MKYILLFFFLFALIPHAFAQLHINELDSDSPGYDDQEFIELRSTTAYFPLDGYLVVLFNGSENGMNRSYFTLDLTGFSTDINGIFLIGSSTVSPAPQYFIDANVIQNGADAVAIYKAAPQDFPEDSPATTQNLIDALAYDTGDADDEILLQLLGLEQQVDEDVHNNKDNESIQRNADGSYSVKTPTPRRTNDGDGVGQIGINFSVEANKYTEGEAFDIEFTTDQVLSKPLNFTLKLTNFGFNQADFEGNTAISIPVDSRTTTTEIRLIDDDFDEGDEELLIQFDSLPAEFIPLRDRFIVRVVDDDYRVSPWGTPLEPTYGMVESTAPENYYAALEGTSGIDLRQAITRLIADPETVRAQTYADVIDMVKEADVNPENSNEVWLLYTEKSKPKLDFQISGESFGKWNREHVFPRSRGGFYSIQADEIADGKAIYFHTSADSIRHGNSDGHALRVVDSRENSRRSNQNYGEYTGPSNTAGSFYGDVARSAFFIALRYTGLELVNGFPEAYQGTLGDLETLLQWHKNDPPDDFEMHRNNVIYGWQNNRNPFIDHPELAAYIWGDKQGETWNSDLALAENKAKTLKIFPNPAQKSVVLSGFSGKKQLKIVDFSGKLILEKSIIAGEKIYLNLSAGIYFLALGVPPEFIIKKLIVM